MSENAPDTTPGEETTPPAEEAGPIKPETIAAAETLFGLSFSDAEREQMLSVLNGRLGVLDSLRALEIDNAVAPVLLFDPRPKPVQGAVPRSYAVPAEAEVTRPPNLEDVAFWPVFKLAELLRTQQVTSVELTKMYLNRLKRYNPHLNCAVTLTEDRALKQARRVDDEIGSGTYRGPLHGIPWGAKDLLAVKGYPTTWGMNTYKDQVIDTDATVVKRLDEAGAVLVAKLSLGALAYGDHWYGGLTRNPWDIAEGSSGSSAGPASAVAGGLVGFAIGTETLGSIVSPATQCGVTGLRPTFGRVSRHGAMALSWTMDKIGPMCRSAADCALVFSAIYGPDGIDATLVDEPFGWSPDHDLRELRVGYFKRGFEQPRVARSKETEPVENPHDATALEVLRKKLGLSLIEIDLPDIPLAPIILLLMAEGAAAFETQTRTKLDDAANWGDDHTMPNQLRAARLLSAVDYIQANRARRVLIERMAEVMREVDVFVTPSFGASVLPLTNGTGHPTVVVPNGFNEAGVPVSLSFVGGLYQEAAALTVAHAYQGATGHHRKHPAMDFGE